MENKFKCYFYLYNHIELVLGASKSILINTKTQAIISIANNVAELLNEMSSTQIEYILNSLSLNNRNIINSYLELLKKENMGFFSNDSSFTQMPILNPEIIIDHFIYDLTNSSFKNLQDSIVQGCELNCNMMYIDIASNFIISELLTINFFNLYVILALDFDLFTKNKKTIISMDNIKEVEIYSGDKNYYEEINQKTINY